MCSIPVDEEEKAFLVMVDYDDRESTYYISSKLAFNLAREYAKAALLCIGADRYQFKNGEPVLNLVNNRSS